MSNPDVARSNWQSESQFYYVLAHEKTLLLILSINMALLGQLTFDASFEFESLWPTRLLSCHSHASQVFFYCTHCAYVRRASCVSKDQTQAG